VKAWGPGGGGPRRGSRRAGLAHTRVAPGRGLAEPGRAARCRGRPPDGGREPRRPASRARALSQRHGPGYAGSSLTVTWVRCGATVRGSITFGFTNYRKVVDQVVGCHEQPRGLAAVAIRDFGASPPVQWVTLSRGAGSGHECDDVQARCWNGTGQISDTVPGNWRTRSGSC